MKKKYYILALTFLCMLSGQQSYGQGSGGDYDYSNIDNFIDQMLADNPDIDVNYFYDTQDYVDFLNSDDNYSNDFVDVNDDGQINEDDNLYRQSLINNIGMNDGNPVECTDAELQALWEAGVHLYEVVIVNDYKDPLFGNNGFFTFDMETSTINHWDSFDQLREKVMEDITYDYNFYATIMRDWVVAHQNVLLGIAHELKTNGANTALAGLAITAIGSMSGVAVAIGTEAMAFGAFAAEVGALLEIYVKYTVNDDSSKGDFIDFVTGQIRDGALDLILPDGAGFSTEIQDLVQTINNAIKQAAGN